MPGSSQVLCLHLDQQPATGGMAVGQGVRSKRACTNVLAHCHHADCVNHL